MFVSLGVGAAHEEPGRWKRHGVQFGLGLQDLHLGIFFICIIFFPQIEIIGCNYCWGRKGYSKEDTASTELAVGNHPAEHPDIRIEKNKLNLFTKHKICGSFLVDSGGAFLKQKFCVGTVTSHTCFPQHVQQGSQHGLQGTGIQQGLHGSQGLQQGIGQGSQHGLQLGGGGGQQGLQLGGGGQHGLQLDGGGQQGVQLGGGEEGQQGLQLGGGGQQHFVGQVTQQTLVLQGLQGSQGSGQITQVVVVQGLQQDDLLLLPFWQQFSPFDCLAA